MILIRRLTFRLYPNQEQTQKLFWARRMHCYAFNGALANRKTQYKRFGHSVSYFEQQNSLPGFKAVWPEYKKVGSQALQATLKRVDLAYNAFFQGLRKRPKFKSIRQYSGWTYPAQAGWGVQVGTTQRYAAHHGELILRDLGMSVSMRGRSKYWGNPSTLTIVYKPGLNQWLASFTVEIAKPDVKVGAQSDLEYLSSTAMDLGTATALTLYDGAEFRELENPRFIRNSETKIKQAEKRKQRKQQPKKQVQKASRRWKSAQKKVSKLKRKVANQRKHWQHKVTTEIACRYDIVVTEQVNTNGMTRKGKKRRPQKAGLNKSILDVGFGTLNQQIQYKVEGKGGLVVFLPTRKVKPSQRCPFCGAVHPDWADLSQRVHHCSDCGNTVLRDKGSVMVMYQTLLGHQPGLGTSLVDVGCLSSTSGAKERKHTGSMKQLGQRKRQKPLQSTSPRDVGNPALLVKRRAG